WGARCNGVGSDEGVGLAVADDLEVEVVGVPAAGEHGVQLLSGLLPGQQAVHGVGGDALGRMDGGGIAKPGRRLNVVGGESDGQLAAVVPDGEVTAPADAGDGPPVPVFHPVGAGEAESAVVAAGDDHISDTRPVYVPQTHFLPGRRSVQTMITGSAVERSDEGAGRGGHVRLAPER